MITLNEIYNIYKKTGLNNNLISLLASDNELQKQHAVNAIIKMNFKNEDDVLMFIAMNI